MAASDRPAQRLWDTNARVSARAVSAAALLALALAAPRDARADDADDVRVEGTRASGFSTRAREDDSAREVTDAASLVEPLPGVHVRRLGADDGFATMSIRG